MSKGGSPLHDKPLLKTIVLLRPPGLEVLSAAPGANPSDLADCAGAPKSRPHCSGDGPADQHPTRLQTMPAWAMCRRKHRPLTGRRPQARGGSGRAGAHHGEVPGRHGCAISTRSVTSRTAMATAQRNGMRPRPVSADGQRPHEEQPDPGHSRWRPLRTQDGDHGGREQQNGGGDLDRRAPIRWGSPLKPIAASSARSGSTPRRRGPCSPHQLSESRGCI